VALKAGGVSLYRLFIPYLIFAIFAMLAISYLDGFIVPKTNAKKDAFAEKYLHGNYVSNSKRQIYRQISPHKILKIGYYNISKKRARHIRFYTFAGDSVKKIRTARSMEWNPKSNVWKLKDIDRHIYKAGKVSTAHIDSVEVPSLSILPRDLARKT